ncbi:DUF2169 family type VI secretion system accessory protein [Marinomonas transparens]|uniref:DUF2169 domain-containing protein n=1 Tax=Marinomonas transparens TaxID=2795388 RepID=A0A934JZZ8_9GAMM|nr:DUF2169 domain-containing protein [Marinomonas transparens]MBJ7539997.1 DUF2169 domain-containing protein [Marinomonas transparens]
MKIIKPKTLGLISRTYNYKANQFTVGGLGFFRLGGDEGFLPDSQCWQQITPLLNEGLSDQLVLDMGFAKAQGEWLLAGSAYTDNGKPATKLQVSAKLGNSHKYIQVVGDRFWDGHLLSLASKARPFTAMPLCYSRAYGGVGDKYNPVGRGAITKANKNKVTGCYALPNLYLTKDKISVDKRPRSVAGFGPLDISLPQRTKFHGRYNQHWLDNVHPGFPHDTDPRYFNAAPEDQQFKGSINPGTEYELTAMHPTQPLICGRLPQMNVRAFITQSSSSDESSGDEFVEIKTHIDTVWFFPELLLGVAIYRGQLAVRDCDGLDIKTLMLAYERVGDESRTADHYKQQLSLRSDKNTAGIHALNEAPLKPKKTASEQLHADTLYQQAKSEHRRKRQQHLEQQVANNKITEQQKQQALLDDINDYPPLPQALIDSGDIDLSQYFKEHDRVTASELADAHVKLAVINEQASRKQAPKESQESLRQRVFNPVYVSAVDTKHDDIKRHAPSSASMALIGQRESRQAAASCTIMSLPLNEVDAELIRGWVVELVQQGVSLAGRDLAGANLSGLDFSHQDLSDVMFEEANLSNCTFINCRLQGAVLTQANVDNAIFDGADAPQVNWSKITASTVSFKQANLTDGQLNATSLLSCDFTSATLDNIKVIEADLSHSCMNHVRCHKGQFMNATLQGTHWHDANISSGNFADCNIRQSVWRHAKLQRTLIVDAKAEQASFCHVTAQKVQFSNLGDFTGADFSNSHWQSCGFRSVNLLQSVINESVFESCDFGEANLNGANLSHSLFKGCMMKQVDFSLSVCRGTLFVLSSLNKATFDRADLKTTTFQNTNLDQAQFLYCQPSKALTQPVASLS